MRFVVSLFLGLLVPLAPVTATAQSAPKASAAQKWVVAWAGSVQGPYPIGNPSAQPDLNVAFPSAETGARDQSFRMILKPEIWGREARLRFSNALGTKPVTFDAVFVGLHLASSALVPGTNRPVTFGGKRTITIAPGDSSWSDAVALPFVRDPGTLELAGRKLAVSFHVPGESGPMTWHAKALQTSYVSMPGAGARSQDESESVFPIRFSTVVPYASATAWFASINRPWRSLAKIKFGTVSMTCRKNARSPLSASSACFRLVISSIRPRSCVGLGGTNQGRSSPLDRCS